MCVLRLTIWSHGRFIFSFPTMIYRLVGLVCKPASSEWEFWSYHIPSPALAVYCLLIFDILTAVQLNLRVVLSWVFLIARDCEQFFFLIFLRLPPPPPWELCVQIQVCLLNGSFVSLFDSGFLVLYIFWMLILYLIHSWQWFSPILWAYANPCWLFLQLCGRHTF